MPIFRCAYRIGCCQMCKGKGRYSFMDEPDQRKTVVCSSCRGTGLVAKYPAGITDAPWKSAIVSEATLTKKAILAPEFFKHEMTKYRYYKLQKEFTR